MAILASENANSDFIVRADALGDLQINPTPVENFYYFSTRRRGRLIKNFILLEKPRVTYLCKVTLIKKDDKFTPRLTFSVRHKSGQIAAVPGDTGEEAHDLKASVSLEECHETFWLLISFLQSLREIEVPEGSFSLVSPREGAIVAGLRERGAASVISIIRQLLATPDVSFSHQDINQLLKRKERLSEFEQGLKNRATDESWWQNFFEKNKWIFGYGLNYQILK